MFLLGTSKPGMHMAKYNHWMGLSLSAAHPACTLPTRSVLFRMKPTEA